MQNHIKSKLDLYLTAVSNDLTTYLQNPQDFQPEFFDDVLEAVNECLDIIHKEQA